MIMKKHVNVLLVALMALSTNFVQAPWCCGRRAVENVAAPLKALSVDMISNPDVNIMDLYPAMATALITAFKASRITDSPLEDALEGAGVAGTILGQVADALTSTLVANNVLLAQIHGIRARFGLAPEAEGTRLEGVALEAKATKINEHESAIAEIIHSFARTIQISDSADVALATKEIEHAISATNQRAALSNDPDDRLDAYLLTLLVESLTSHDDAKTVVSRVTKRTARSKGSSAAAPVTPVDVELSRI